MECIRLRPALEKEIKDINMSPNRLRNCIQELHRHLDNNGRTSMLLEGYVFVTRHCPRRVPSI